MNSKEEQIEFVNELCKEIAKGIVNQIENGKVPAEWDGIELRWLVQEHASTNWGNKDKKRKREYNNIVIVNNL